MPEKLIELQHITKVFDGVTVLDDVDFYINRNEFITLLGPSGCGKTTTLRILGGFEKPDEGRVLFEGVDITTIPPYKRQLNTVFQRYALFPHMNVFDNIAFGLHINKRPKDEVRQRVMDALRLVDLTGFEYRHVDSLSGGQQQRVAIARAIVNRPQVLLLDEPLAALDLKMRKGMQRELKEMQQQLGITFVYVTHDQEEALTMSDTIVVMNGGVLQQIGPPTSIYNEPKNRFVARFIGESNILDGIMPKDCLVRFGGAEFECVDTGFAPDEAVDVVVRPEDIYIVDEKNGHITGEVISVTFMGMFNEIIVRADDGFEWRIQDTGSRPVGSRVGLIVRPDDIHIMPQPKDSTEAVEVNVFDADAAEEAFAEELEPDPAAMEDKGYDA
nr:ABC transporter ATP-binding protein [bacterium]